MSDLDAPDEAETKRLIARFIGTYQHRAPKLAQWVETALPEGLAVLTPPPPATAYVQRDRDRQP